MLRAVGGALGFGEIQRVIRLHGAAHLFQPAKGVGQFAGCVRAGQAHLQYALAQHAQPGIGGHQAGGQPGQRGAGPFAIFRQHGDAAVHAGHAVGKAAQGFFNRFLLCFGIEPGQADSDVLRKAGHRISTQAQGGGVEFGRAGDAGDGGVEYFLQLAAHGAQLAPAAVAVEPAAVLLPVSVLTDAGTACAQRAGDAGAGGFLFAASAEDGRHGDCGHCCPTPSRYSAQG